jgi:CTP synthase
LTANSKAFAAYGRERISERHRHRYEFNTEFREAFESRGMIFSGMSPDGQLMEIIEYKEHPWFVACQFHPELKSRPTGSHPLFRDFIGSALTFARER